MREVHPVWIALLGITLTLAVGCGEPGQAAPDGGVDAASGQDAQAADARPGDAASPDTGLPDGGDAALDGATTPDGDVPDAACQVSIPGGPLPPHGSTEVLPAQGTALGWTEVPGATSYHVYLGTSCPPPAYPDASYVATSAAERTGLSLDFGQTYCWQVVAHGAPGCNTVGPVWSFGTILQCTLAPACTNVILPPVGMMHAPSLDIFTHLFRRAGASVLTHREALFPWQGFSGPLMATHRSTTEPGTRRRAPEASSPLAPPPPPPAPCLEPKLRLNLPGITVAEPLAPASGDNIYCVVQAESPAGGELRVTPMTPRLQAGDAHYFATEDTVFWGQLSGPVEPAGSLLVTYDCFASLDPASYVDLLAAIDTAATTGGGSAGSSNGWLFSSVGTMAPVVSAALATNADAPLFHAQQVVADSQQFDLTTGAYWTVRQYGNSGGSDWDWELRIEAWGCVDNGL